MSYFAQLSEANTVIRVVEVACDSEESGAAALQEMYGQDTHWIQTFKYEYNEALGGWQYDTDAPRKNFASVGDTFDADRNCFVAPKPYNSWVLNEEDFKWQPPVEYPSDTRTYFWDESVQNWALNNGTGYAQIAVVNPNCANCGKNAGTGTVTV
jgi:hypothetical protein